MINCKMNESEYRMNMKKSVEGEKMIGEEQGKRGKCGTGEVLRYVFSKTVPVVVGYIFLGTAYGILMSVEWLQRRMGIGYQRDCICRRSSMWVLTFFWQR